MTTPDRREFLLRSAAFGCAALGLPACLRAGQEPAPTAPATPPPADMAIARWAAWEGGVAPPDIVYKLTEQALAALGGLARFVKKGDTVWVKPNIAWNRKAAEAANTHPEVVAALVRLCLAAGAKKVKVGDFTCHPARETYTNSGIAAAAEAAGAEVVYLDEKRFRAMKIGGNLLQDHPVCPDIIESDLVINVPIVKHHGSTDVTLCMKNYMGVVGDRRKFHQDLPTTIADITQFMKPRLCVLDAIRILKDHGPIGGDIQDVKVLNTVAAGVDIVALDAFGCELLGRPPAEVQTVALGAKYGLGRIDYRRLALKELAVS